jgi:hypothetical protein
MCLSETDVGCCCKGCPAAAQLLKSDFSLSINASGSIAREQ